MLEYQTVAMWICRKQKTSYVEIKLESCRLIGLNVSKLNDESHGGTAAGKHEHEVYHGIDDD